MKSAKKPPTKKRTKRFLYARSDEGGMEDFTVTNANELSEGYLVGWMKGAQKKADTELVAWMAEADVGDLFYHRLGIAVRLKDVM